MSQLKTHTFIVALLAIVFSACAQKDFITTETGLKYAKVTKGTGERPNDGDFMMINIAYYDDKENKMFSSADNGQGALPLNYVDSVFTNNGSLEESFRLCGKGDSLIIEIPAETVFSKTFKRPIPDSIAAESIITIHLGVSDILTPEEFEKFRNERFEIERKKEELLAKEQIIKDTKIMEDYLTKNNINAKTTPEGLKYVITSEGSGDKPVVGSTVTVNYTGKLLDGTMFDSSIEEDAKLGGVYSEGRDYNKPFEFPLGQGRVIRGWDIGIALLNKGAKATLYIPSSLGYGSRGAGDIIKPNSILIFDVELVDYK